jgi:hypothetical protein
MPQRHGPAAAGRRESAATGQPGRGRAIRGRQYRRSNPGGQYGRNTSGNKTLRRMTSPSTMRTHRGAGREIRGTGAGPRDTRGQPCGYMCGESPPRAAASLRRQGHEIRDRGDTGRVRGGDGDHDAGGGAGPARSAGRRPCRGRGAGGRGRCPGGAAAGTRCPGPVCSAGCRRRRHGLRRRSPARAAAAARTPAPPRRPRR